MRLIRVGKPAARVADDIRASLTAIGRGNTDVGGIALVDVTPPGVERPFDAVAVTPFGVVIVIGVDLPGPALRLEAPLRGQWKADNWPLVGDGEAINPAIAGLAAADELAKRLNTLTNMAIPVGLVLAVGPFVDNVVTVPLPGDAVRVVHPSPSKLRDAIASLAVNDGRPCSVEQARAVLRLIDPEVPIQTDETLGKEGFATGAAFAHVHAHAAQAAQPALAAEASTTPAAPPTQARARAAAIAAAGTATGAAAAPAVRADERPTELMQLPLATGQPQPPAKREVRLLPIAAVVLLVAGIVAAIVMAAGGSADEPPESKNAQVKPTRYAIEGIEYTEVSAATDTKCDAHTYGDVQASLEKTPCTGMQLGSYLATVAGKRAAVSVAVVSFAEPAQAKQLRKIADTAGSGGAADLATVRKQWPDQPPTFDNAAYRSAASGEQVRLVRAAWVSEPSSPEDKTLARIAQTAFEVPLD